MPEGGLDRQSELVEFALEKLPAMRQGDGVFCHAVTAPGLEPEGRSLRYTLISLLGLLRAQEVGHSFSIHPG